MPNTHSPDAVQGAGARASDFLQHLIEALPVAGYFCDLQGQILYSNTAAQLMWGEPPAEQLRWSGARRMLSPIDGSIIPPEETPAALAVRLGTVQQADVVIERPDGSRLTVQSRANTVCHPEGGIMGVVTVLTDMTAQREAEISQARLAAIVASSDDAIISKTLEGQILSWNEGARRLFGYTPEETVGKHITMIIPPEKQDEEWDILSRLVRGERIDHYETVRVTRDGDLRNVSLTSSPVRDSYGNIVGASKIARDVTDKRREEETLRALHEELRQANLAKDRFLATLAHELRNPLAPLGHLVHLLRMPNTDAKDVERWLQVMERQLGLMTRLIDDLMDLSRITTNKFELRKEPVALANIVQAAIETSKPLMDAHKHHFAVEVTAELAVLDVDAVRLTQAISNILNNAAKYTPSGGEIRLTASVVGNEAVITIADNGVGVPAGEQERIFEMFVQAPDGRLRSEGGLGVGLHLARTLAEMHGGTLTVQSEGAGKGSRFTFTIPVSR